VPIDRHSAIPGSVCGLPHLFFAKRLGFLFGAFSLRVRAARASNRSVALGFSGFHCGPFYIPQSLPLYFAVLFVLF
jgi:hypothetical protein